MASYRGHLAASTLLGAAYGAAAAWSWHFDWGPAILGAGLTVLGGLLPDLDSESGVPVRELFSLAGVATPVLLIPRLRGTHLSMEQMLVVLAGIYLFVRYGLAEYFKRITVHRGMFHSLPALFIAGLTVFLFYGNGDGRLRMYLAGGTMLGFLSHLVLDELWAVDFRGAHIRLNRFAGSALKLSSPSLVATTFAYFVLIALAGLAWLTW